MTKPVIYYCLIFLCVFSCNETRKEDANAAMYGSHNDFKDTSTSINHNDSSIKKTDILDKNGNYSFTISEHKIDYSDSLLFNDPDWSLEWTLDKIDNTDSIFTYKVDPIYHKTTRVLKRGLEYSLLIKESEIRIPLSIGYLDEVVGGRMIFCKYDGDEYGGIITKYLCEINKNSIEVLDSIPVGEFGEGWGATERVITKSGKPLGGIINPEDKYYWDYKNLLVMKPDDKSDQRILLINGISSDTIVDFDIQLPNVCFLRYNDDKLILYNNERSRLNYLQLFDKSGKPEWKVAADTYSDILVSPTNNMIIATGYSFPGIPDKNSQAYFIIAYDLKDGNRVWDFPTGLAYDNDHKIGDRIHTSDLFEIRDSIFGVVVGKSASYGSDGHQLYTKNKLIIFDAFGKINFVINLSDAAERYTFNKINDEEFDLIGCHENWSFKIKKTDNNEIFE